MKLTVRYLITVIAAIGFQAAHGQGLVGDVVRLRPTLLPALCSIGDLRTDSADSYKLKQCVNNTWSVISGGSGSGLPPYIADTLLISDGVTAAWSTTATVTVLTTVNNNDLSIFIPDTVSPNDGGNIEINAASTDGTKTGGGITLQAGSAATGVPGDITFFPGSANVGTGHIVFGNSDESSAGQVWVSVDEFGAGHWTAAFTNPMTTIGDLIYGGASGTPLRLAPPADQKVLAYLQGSTQPFWQYIINANVDSTAGITYSKLNLTASVTNADIAAAAGIVDTKLATLSTAGKVANSATSATPTATNSTIVVRDGSGNFAAGNITASLIGLATTASTSGTAAFAAAAGTAAITTAFAATPTPCSANNYAIAIGPNGNLTCSTVTASVGFSAVTGTAAVTQGGTGLVAGTSGGVLAFVGSTTLASSGALSAQQLILGGGAGSVPLSLAAGTGGQVLQSSGTGTAPVWQDILNSAGMYNCAMKAAVVTNAIVFSLKQSDGSSDPTATSPCKVAFRNATATDAAFNILNVTAASNFTLSVGSSAGCAATVSCTMYSYLINNGGTTVAIGAFQGGILDEGTNQTAVSEGGTGTADATLTLFSTAAMSGVPIRLISRIYITPAANFTWSAAPTASASVPFRQLVRTPKLTNITAVGTTAVSFATQPFPSYVKIRVVGGGGGGQGGGTGGGAGTAGNNTVVTAAGTTYTVGGGAAGGSGGGGGTTVTNCTIGLPGGAGGGASAVGSTYGGDGGGTLLGGGPTGGTNAPGTGGTGAANTGVGGGGGGGGAAVTSGIGGGGGAYCEVVVPVSNAVPATIDVIIGATSAGGTAGTTGGAGGPGVSGRAILEEIF